MTSNDVLRLETHRAADELGKYATEMEIGSMKGISKHHLKGFIEDLMVQMSKVCMMKGADMIGHIKSIFQCDHGNIMSSMIDGSAKVKMKDSLASDKVFIGKFTMHAVVHGIWDDKVREAVMEVLPGVFKRWGVPYRIISDFSVKV